MPDYTKKVYGRHGVVNAIVQMLDGGQNIAMPGPRRLGKSFVLDRIVEWGPGLGWQAIKLELAGFDDFKSVYRYICEHISAKQSAWAKAKAFMAQRAGQLLNPRHDQNSNWFQNVVNHDHQTQFERQLEHLNQDTDQRWVLLIDELPIFLKALHDKGADGVAQARQFMNNLARLQAKFPRVRWLITGSIGIEPLARAGQYWAVLTKYTHFQLETLTHAQACAYVCDLPALGEVHERQQITPAEAQAMCHEVQWMAAYYLRELGKCLRGEPENDPQKAHVAVSKALDLLIAPQSAQVFAAWEEHIQKHFPPADQATAFAWLTALAKHQPANWATLAAALNQPQLPQNQLFLLVQRLHADGYVQCSDWETAQSTATFAYTSPILRRRWKRFPPTVH